MFSDAKVYSGSPSPLNPTPSPPAPPPILVTLIQCVIGITLV